MVGAAMVLMSGALPGHAATVVEGEWGTPLTTTCSVAPSVRPGMIPGQTVMTYGYGCSARYVAWPQPPASVVMYLTSTQATTGVACGQWTAKGPGYIATTGNPCVPLNTVVLLPLGSSPISNGPARTEMSFLSYPNGYGTSTVDYWTVTGHLDYYVAN